MPRDERRRQILAAAAELFARRGFAGTTTRDIAATAGTTETVLFRHFPTKDALYAAILEAQVPAANFGRWLDELRAIAARRDDEALFAAMVAAVLESYRHNSEYHRLMLFAALEGHDLVRIAHAKYTSPFIGFLRDYVAQRQAEGALRRMRPEWVVHMVLALPAQFGEWSALGINPLDLTEREVAAQVVALLRGLRAES